MDVINPPQLMDDDFSALFDTKHLELPSILPKFFIPPLPDEPKDPITDKGPPQVLYQPNVLLRRLPVLQEPLLDRTTHDVAGLEDLRQLWAQAVKSPQQKNGPQVLSWDTLRPAVPHLCSPFLSEQSSHVFSAVRYHVDPPFLERVLYLSEDELFNDLKMTVLGISSPIHHWDEKEERFLVSGAKSIIIERKDALISASISKRFLTIGTLLRRIEIFTQSTKSIPGSSEDGPTLHALCHSMYRILDHVYNQIGTVFTECIKSEGLTTTWTQLASIELSLNSLAVFCCRDEHRLPEDYPSFDVKPQPLLSRIYEHINMHIERFSPKPVTAIFAYLLTHTSRHYMFLMCSSVGYCGKPTPDASTLVGDDALEPTTEAAEEDDYMLPFLPPQLKAVLPNAQKSLKLLKAADSNHNVIDSLLSHGPIEWIWTTEDVTHPRSCRDSNRADVSQPSTGSIAAFAAEKAERNPLLEFHIFDLQPGSQLPLAPIFNAYDEESSDSSSLGAFIASFPESHPAMTPSLSLLVLHIFTPLIEHATSLSASILSVFLTPSPSFEGVNFQAHLTLLRSYLLMTSHTYKSRLTAALFSDTEESRDNSNTIFGIRAQQHVKSFSTSGSNSQDGARSTNNDERPWAVGLAPSLTERETWPPFGTDLSFSLRTVIVDSLAASRTDGDMDMKQEYERLHEEAENRLGFAVRELEIDEGKNGWMNPFSIEALDFLYMDYKPPRTLEVLITPGIISRYQRIFTLLLRIMRVENALNATCRISGKLSKPIFATLAQANKQLLHFRFIAQSFVSSLSSYITDTAIKSNFDAFERQLSISGSSSAYFQAQKGTDPLPFPDVFALSEAHSKVLDDILSACLLRTGQRSALELISEILEMILTFAVLVGRLWKEQSKEYDAAPVLEELLGNFKAKMSTLVKVLKALVARDGGGEEISGTVGAGAGGGSPDLLNHLVVRLTMNGWWSTATSGDAQAKPVPRIQKQRY